MRPYLDQMFRSDLADRLRVIGHDVIRAVEVGQARADDEQILRTSVERGRSLVTLDAHFGDWVVLPLDRHPGVIRLKINPTTTANAFDLLEPLLSQHRQEDFANQLVIVSLRGSRWIRTG